MKTLKILLGLLLFGLYTFSIYSCTKDLLSGDQKDIKSGISNRDRSLGNYSVVDGRLYFPTVEDYNLTISYIDNADENEILSFRNSFNLVTVAKVYSEFMNELNVLDSNSTQLPALEAEYSGRIKISTSLEGDRVYNPKLLLMKELLNLDGEVAVQNSIYKFLDTKVVSVTDPTRVNMNTITENTITDEEQGIIVSDIDLRTSPPCCPKENEKNTMYDSEDNRKRVRIYYFNKAWNEYQNYYGSGSYKYSVTPKIYTEAITYHERHKHVGPYWWWGDLKAKKLKQIFNQSITHNMGFAHIPNPLVVNSSVTNENTAKIKISGTAVGLYFVVSSLGIIEPEICITSVHQKGINLDNNQYCQFDCGN